MNTRSSYRGLALVCALLAMAGCKKSNTAADAESVDGVRLLDKGERPREELRYNIAAGTTTSSTTTFRVATLATAESSEAASVTILPGLRLDVVSGPAERTEGGVKYKVDVVKSEAIVPSDFNEGLAEQLRDGAALAQNLGGWVEVDDRGRVLSGELNQRTKRSDVPVRLVRMIVNTRETLTRVLLPEEKVGLGARWEARKTVKAYGFDIQQVSTYTLVDRVGDELMLNVTIQQLALPQTIEFPDEGIAISVQSMTGQAEGQIVLDLGALESDASGSGSSEDHILVKTPEGAESIDISEEFEVQIANTTGLHGD